MCWKLLNPCIKEITRIKTKDDQKLMFLPVITEFMVNKKKLIYINTILLYGQRNNGPRTTHKFEP